MRDLPDYNVRDSLHYTYIFRVNTDCLIKMVGIWRETGVHLVSCVTSVCFVTVAYRSLNRGYSNNSMPKIYFDALSCS